MDGSWTGPLRLYDFMHYVFTNEYLSKSDATETAANPWMMRLFLQLLRSKHRFYWQCRFLETP